MFGYRGFAEIGISYNQAYGFFDGGLGFDITTTHGCRFNEYIFLGAGAGIFGEGHGNNKYRAMKYMIPVYADLRTYFSRTHVKPFVELQLGGVIPIGGDKIKERTFGSAPDYSYYGYKTCDHLHLQAGFGIEYRRLTTKLSWRLRQTNEIDTEYTGGIVSADERKSKTEHILTIALGIAF